MLVFNIDFRQDNIKHETLKFQHSENQKFEQNLTFMQTFDGNVSENVNSTNTLQSQLFSSIDVQIDRGSIERVPMELPEETDGSFKTYMSYKLITDTSSPQYALQQQAYTDSDGFRRVGDAYCIALGSAFGTEIGTKYKITLDTGITFVGILSDCKDDKHTDDSNRYIEKNGNICEFLVSVNKIDEMSKVMGDMSYSNLQGGIVKIERMIE